MRLKRTLLYILLLFFVYCNHANAIDRFKFPKEKLGHDFCDNLLDDLKFSSFPYGEEPFITYIDLLIEDIHHIDGKNLDFEASFSLWIYWKDPRLTKMFKEKNLYSGKGKPAWLCDYEADALWGSQKRLLDPGVEFYNRKDKPDFQSGLVDWVDIFSDGTIETRLRDTAKFKSNEFNFGKFPFDTQIISFELWSEFPSTMISLAPSKSMQNYSDSLYDFEGEDGIVIPAWELKNVKFDTYEYVEEDGFPYKGFRLFLEVKRLSSYYIYKVIIPILLILSISWSVFWIDRSQLESKVNITMVALLSLIAYNLIMDEAIPKLDYLTFMDAFILLSYLYTGAATILCVYSYYRYRKYRRKINLVDYYAKFVGPISYIVGVFICSIIYL